MIAQINTWLQPGGEGCPPGEPFKGLPLREKPLKQFWHSVPVITGLKPGVNKEMLFRL